MDIPTLKSRLNIPDIAAHLGIEVHPRTLKAICPFHPDKTPSLQFSAEKQICTCFSSNCNLGTVDVIGLTEKKLSLSTHEAIKYLIPLAGGEIQPTLTAEPGTTISETDRITVLTRLMAGAGKSLRQTKRAKDYCKARGLDPEKLEIGYLADQYNKSWNEGLQVSASLIGLVHEPALRSKGLSPKFRHCIVFPMKNKAGQVVSVYGRSILNNDTQKHFYLKGKHQGLYPNYPNEDTAKLILTESIIDAATLLQIPEITAEYDILALYGTNGLTVEHRCAISLQNEVIFMMDGDVAGEKAAQKNADELHKSYAGTISKTTLPEGEDVNSLLQGHDPEILTEILANRTILHKGGPAFSISNENKNHVNPENPEILSKNHILSNPKLNALTPDQITYETPTLKLTIWGGIEYTNLHRLRLSLFLENKENQQTFRDEVNLYSHRSRKTFLESASEELELPQSELKTIIADFTGQVETYRLDRREAFKQKDKTNLPTLTESERQTAIKHLKDPHLIKHLKQAMEKIGLVGETENGLLLFLIFLTRFFENPLHALVHGTSGSGKTNLLKTILKLVPEESKYTTTALSENVLFRPPHIAFWKNKILLLEDLDGSYKALYPLREFMSNQHISKFVSEPDPKTGQFKQRLLEAHGPVVIAGATTKDKVYEDNSNRSFLLHVDESSAQVAKVLSFQNRQAAGLVDKTAIETTCEKVQNIQRMLRPITVVNPFQPMLELPTYIFKKLRTNTHYITLIKAVTFLNQYRREQKRARSGIYIETTLEDVALANELSKASLLRKSDELSGQVRDFFERLKVMVKKSGSQTFQARAVREQLRMHPMKLNRRINELRQRGYIKYTGGNRKNGYEYEITIWDDYQVLQKGLEIMDEILEKLRKKYPDGKYNRSVTRV